MKNVDTDADILDFIVLFRTTFYILIIFFFSPVRQYCSRVAGNIVLVSPGENSF